jgi:hypothetical protein
LVVAGPASRQGRLVADNLCGRDSRYRASQGTSVLKACNITATTTGLNEKSLNRVGIPVRKVYAHPVGHTSYYRGTAQMHLQLVLSPVT